jgi:hypothetical protein
VGRRPRRPWGFWLFEIGECPPEPDEEDDITDHRELEAVRLAELGELNSHELAALREQAKEARLRVGTTSERISGGGREHGVSDGPARRGFVGDRRAGPPAGDVTFAASAADPRAPGCSCPTVLEPVHVVRRVGRLALRQPAG